MRRLLLLVAAVCVFAALAAVAAKGATLSVTLDTPAVTAVGETVAVTEAPTGTEVTEVDVTSAEVVATPEPASSFLCWNREMTSPVVYADAVADTMWATGSYFEPQAILGTVEGGTNIGAYHLVCNAPSTMTATGEGLGGSGEVYSAATMSLYHRQHIGGNDLNLYHIYK